MLTGLILVVLAASGVALTVLVVVVVAIRQEPRNMELSNVAPSRVAIRGGATVMDQVFGETDDGDDQSGTATATH